MSFLNKNTVQISYKEKSTLIAPFYSPTDVDNSIEDFKNSSAEICYLMGNQKQISQYLPENIYIIHQWVNSPEESEHLFIETIQAFLHHELNQLLTNSILL